MALSATCPPQGRKTRAGDEGFTLIELLVVILIIGILAGIALPLYLEQSEKANDAVAQSNARSLAAEVKLCNADARDYAQCDDPNELSSNGQTGLPIGDGPGQVWVSESSEESFRITARSLSDGGGRTFSVAGGRDGPLEFSCDPDGGGCHGGTW